MQISVWHEEYEPSVVWRRVPHVPRQASEGVNAGAKCVQWKEEKSGGSTVATHRACSVDL